MAARHPAGQRRPVRRLKQFLLDDSVVAVDKQLYLGAVEMLFSQSWLNS